MPSATVNLATKLMRLRERVPDPQDGSLSEIFKHPRFTEATDAERERIMWHSAQSRYEDEITFPWDTYFGMPLRRWIKGKVLDLGCFTGGRSVAWCGRYELNGIAGVDVDPIFIQAAQRFAAARGVPADFRVGYAEKIPWADRSLDAILSFDVLEHVRDVTAALTECQRVLRPGGRLLAVFPSYFQPVEHHLSLVTSMPGLQYLFTGPTLIEAYCDVLRQRGEDASWYARPARLAAWERGNTINGMTNRRFRRLLRDQGWVVEHQTMLPIGAVGRRAQAGHGRWLAAAARPLTRVPGLQEVALHRLTYILRRP